MFSVDDDDDDDLTHDSRLAVHIIQKRISNSPETRKHIYIKATWWLLTSAGPVWQKPYLASSSLNLILKCHLIYWGCQDKNCKEGDCSPYFVPKSSPGDWLRVWHTILWENMGMREKQRIYSHCMKLVTSLCSSNNLLQTSGGSRREEIAFLLYRVEFWHHLSGWAFVHVQ